MTKLLISYVEAVIYVYKRLFNFQVGKEYIMKKIICYLLLSALLINVALNSNAFKIYGA